ncbi:iron ABC transporter permease [Sphingomonas lacunae]|uniref:Iron ABC transporter permease n=1 Tax=Sphingomonas lacunae TaxID=2698828 RepID=A0A6M4AY03_9SPHN|nr:iron ABC transporter permease [Sphingomonas lacunae]QJQ32919.1 iron ABC transporter permease [Sphingomonas lacunae]
MMRTPLLVWLGALLLLCTGMSLALGPSSFALSEWLSLLGGQPNGAVQTILLDVRLPRATAAALAGCALGASGTAMQGLMRNPLAEPGVMGVSATAALAATSCVYFGLAATSPLLVPIASLVGAIAATSVVAGAALRLRGIASLILIGVAMSAIAGAMMALLVNMAPNPFSLSDLINWTAGSVANRDWDEIGFGAPFILSGVALLLWGRRNLSALALGEEAAHGMGVDLARTRLLVIAGTGIATGGAVAIAGMIGFVGLIAPHMVRKASGHDAGLAILPSALAGASLLLVSDMVVRLLPWGNELHLGTLAALIGAPLFALIALRMGSIRHG